MTPTTTQNTPHIWDCGQIGYTPTLGYVKIHSVDFTWVRVHPCDADGNLTDQINTHRINKTDLQQLTDIEEPENDDEDEDEQTTYVTILPTAHATLTNRDDCRASIHAAHHSNDPYNTDLTAWATLDDLRWMSMALMADLLTDTLTRDERLALSITAGEVQGAMHDFT